MTGQEPATNERRARDASSDHARQEIGGVGCNASLAVAVARRRLELSARPD
ncbi:MAG: hypothetical protein ABSE47_09385 [Acidimicrobiales bacterium]|jgi:hypothetical protein